jgi:hypothetical protein
VNEGPSLVFLVAVFLLVLVPSPQHVSVLGSLVLKAI